MLWIGFIMVFFAGYVCGHQNSGGSPKTVTVLEEIVERRLKTQKQLDEEWARGGSGDQTT